MAAVTESLTVDDHGLVARLPRRSRSVGSEEFLKRVNSVRMMHPNDPFCPCEVLDGIAHVSKLPVDERDDLAPCVKEQVLGTEVAMYSNRPVTAQHRCQHGRAIALELPEQRSGCSQDRLRRPRAHQLLTRCPVNPRHAKPAMWLIDVRHCGNRKDRNDTAQAFCFAAKSGSGITTFVHLLDGPADAAGLVRVALRESIVCVRHRPLRMSQ